MTVRSQQKEIKGKLHASRLPAALATCMMHQWAAKLNLLAEAADAGVVLAGAVPEALEAEAWYSPTVFL